MWDLLILIAALLLSGLLLCFRGLSIFKILQMLLSGLAFGMIGLRLQAAYGGLWLYILAGVLAIIGAIIGYRKYKFGVFLCCSLATFLVVIAFYWKQAVMILKAVAGDVIDSVTMLKIYVQSAVCGVDVSESVEKITNFQFASYADEFQQMGELLKKGMLWASVASILVGFLSLFLVDYVVIGITASLGATILAMMLSLLLPLAGPWYTFAVVAFAVLGFTVQLGRRGRRRRRKRS